LHQSFEIDAVLQHDAKDFFHEVVQCDITTKLVSR